MGEEENFGYSVPVPAVTHEDFVRSLEQVRKIYKRYTVLSFLEAVSVPYVAYKSSNVFPEPWDSVVASGLLLTEILAAGACVYSAYTWRKASKHLRELEQKIFQEKVTI